jgi:hypothetical protein
VSPTLERLGPPSPTLELQLAFARGASVIGGLAGAMVLHADPVRALGVLTVAWWLGARLRASLLGSLPRVLVGQAIVLLAGDRRPIWPGDPDEEGTNAAWFCRSVGTERTEWLLLLTWPDGRAGQLRLRTAVGVESLPAVDLDAALPGLASLASRAARAEGGWVVFDDIEGHLLRALGARLRAAPGVILAEAGAALRLGTDGWAYAGPSGRVEAPWAACAWGSLVTPGAAEPLARLALALPGGPTLALPVPAQAGPTLPEPALPVHPLAAAWLLHHVGHRLSLATLARRGEPLQPLF